MKWSRMLVSGLTMACSSPNQDSLSGLISATVCVPKYPATQYGYGLPSDASSLPPEDEAAQECSDGRAPPTDPSACSKALLMSVDAALCIARANGLAEGPLGLQGWLVYNYGYRRVIYAVKNTLWHDAGAARGDGMDIDAITGDVLGRGGWESTP